MPRIKDAYLDCVIYLYPTEVDAEDGTRLGGSGFLVSVPTHDLPTNFLFIYAITNKHVAKNARFIRMNSMDGRMKVYSTENNSWYYHADGDDLAACLISFNPLDFKFAHVPRSQFLTLNIVNEYNVGPGDEVFSVGRFVNHEGKQRNLPTVRFGNISQMPSEPILPDDGFAQESFHCEIKSLAGYSGSPVFVHILPFSERENVKNWLPGDNWLKENVFYEGFGSHGPWLLGVNWGHLNDWAPVCGNNKLPVNPDPELMQVKLNTGLATVVPAWKLAELLNSGSLAKDRNAIEDKARAGMLGQQSLSPNSFKTEA